MRSPSLLVDIHASRPEPRQGQETYDRVRRTLDEALAELELEIELDDAAERPLLSRP